MANIEKSNKKGLATASNYVQIFLTSIDIRSASNLIKADIIGKSDPYCKIYCFDQVYTTQTIMKTLDPVWNEKTTFCFFEEPKELKFEVWDWDGNSKDDPIGDCTLNLHGFYDNNHPGFDGNLTLLHVKHGEINIKVKGKKLLPIELENLTRNLQEENQNLEQKIQQQNTSISNINNNINTLNNDITTLKNSKSILSDECKHHSDNLEQLKSTEKDLRNELDELKNEYNKLNKQNEELNNQINNKNNEMNQLNESIKICNIAKEEYDDQIIQIKKEIEIRQNEIKIESEKKQKKKEVDNSNHDNNKEKQDFHGVNNTNTNNNDHNNSPAKDTEPLVEKPQPANAKCCSIL